MGFLTKIKQILGIQADLFFYPEDKIQDALAPLLRKAAIEHLTFSKEVVAKSFRGEYVNAGVFLTGNTCQEFLAKQAQKGAWGTYIEATVLGEALGCHVVVTPIKNGIEQNLCCLYRAANDDAPTVHLYNTNNTHWFVNDKTKGRGDCLYNAFAQALQGLVKSDLRFEPPQKPAVSKASEWLANGFSNRKTIQAEEIIAHQHAIEKSVSHQFTPKQMEQQLSKEKKRLSKLPLGEQQQIADDYKLALKLACEEIGSIYSAPAHQEKEDPAIAAQIEGILSY